MTGDHSDVVLLVSSEADTTTDYLARRLAHRATVVRLDMERFTTDFGVKFRYQDGRVRFRVVHESIAFDPDIVRSVYYRSPGRLTTAPGIADPSLRQEVRQEWLACFEGLLARAVDACWVNHPDRAHAAENKILQLSTAHQFGLTVPDTQITSDEQCAREFVAAHDGNVVVKPLAEPTPGDDPHGGRSTGWTGSDPERLGSLRLAPCILQERVAKSVEIRAVVVGTRVLAAEVHSRLSPISATDWWRYELPRIPYLHHSMDPTVASGCVAFTAALGLNFATVDLILTPDGRYVFLELDPHGQWGWIEELTGLPICAALTDLLVDPAAHGAHTDVAL